MRPLRPIAAAALAILAAVLPAGWAAAQEADHLACVKVKDDKNAVPDGPVPVAISDIYGDAFSECEVKKVKMVSLCFKVVNTAANGGNDPRAGESAADAYACYKVRCKTGQPDGSINANDNFATRFVTSQKLLTFCAPVDLP
jgi:hypothetical protein